MTKKRFLSRRLACLFTTALISTSLLSNLANANPVTIANAETDTTFTDDDIITVSGATAIIDLAGADQAVSLTSTANVATALTVDAVTSMTLTGDLNAATGSALTVSIIQGNFIIAGSVTETGTGTATINIGAGDELNFTGTTKTIASAITSTDATGTLDIDGTVTFSDSVQAGIITTAAATTFSSTLINTGLMTISGATTVTGELTGTGAVVIGAATTLSSNASFNNATETLLNNALTFNGTTLTATGANGIETANAAAALTLSGTANQTIAAKITPGTTNHIVITNSNTAGTVTFNEQLGVVGGALAELIDTDTSTTSVFKKEVGAVLFTVDGTATLTLDGNQATNLDINTAGTLIIDDTITNGQEVFLAGTGVVDGSVAGTGNIKMPANLLNGQTLVLIAETTDAADAAIVVDVEAAVFDTALRTYTVSAVAIGGDDNNITITAADNSASTVASNLGTNVNKGTALIEAGKAVVGDATALDAFSNALNAEGGSSATDDTRLANQVAPQTDMITGSTIAAKAVTSGVQNVMASRLASLRSGDAYSTGVVTGNGMAANSGFIQAFGSTVEQKAKGNEFGYDADTTGFAIGVDGKVDGGAVIGISYARSEADVDGKGTGRAKNDITTDSVSLYADYATKDGYIEGSITYGQSENKGSRIINTGGLANTYSSDYDSEQYSFRLSGGVPQSVGNDAFITPFATATISQIKADAYTERSTTAGDALRLRVNQDTVDSQVGSIGVKYHQVIKDGNTTFTPEIKVAVNQEFGDAKITTTNTYQGGGASFKNSTDVEETSGTAGIGLSIASDNITFNISYDVDVKDQYLGHGAQAKLSAKF